MATYSQRVVWTAIPRGNYGPGTLHVAVFVAPQLSTDDTAATLADFPDFRHWPTVPVTYSVSVNGVVIEGDDVTVVTEPAADPDVWEGTFSDTTPVRSYVPADELRNARIRSVPVGDLVAYIRDVYTTVLGQDASTTELPAVQDLLGILDPVSFYPGRVPGTTGGTQNPARHRDIVEAIDQQLRADGFVPAGFAAGADAAHGRVPTAFVQHEQFLRRHDHVGGKEIPPPVVAPTRDFHDYLSVLGHYRELIRLLGLAVDLRVALPRDFQLPPDPCDVQVAPRWTPKLGGPTRNVSPITKATLLSPPVDGAGPFFLAHPRPSRPMLVGGRLDLSDSARYLPIELDHDGATIKVRMLAEDLARQQDPKHKGPSTPERSALPSLRSGGISVAMIGDPADADKPPLAGEVSAEIGSGLANADTMISGNATPALWAEDLNRGFRFDVWDSETRRWHSLSARAGSFAFTPPGKEARHVAFADEAVHQAVPSKDPAADGEPVTLRQQQTMFHWTGWSLGAHRPGRTLKQPYEPGAAEHATKNQAPAPPSDYPLGITGPLNEDGLPAGPMPIAAPASLPRLRFGHTYFVRARGADVVGDSVPFGDPTTGPGDDGFNAFRPCRAVYYGRFEPVQSPPLVFHDEPPAGEPFATGEPAHPTPGESIERLVIRSNYEPGSGEPPAPLPNPATPVNARHVVPPKVSVEMIERHGLLDIGGPVPVDPSIYGLVAVRDEGGLLNDGRVAAVVTDPNVTVDWLPDPMARGVTLVGLPGANGPVRLPFFRPEREWYFPTPWRIDLQEGDGPPSAIDGDGEHYLKVYLPKADVAVVRVSAHLLDPGGSAPPDPELFAIFHNWLSPERQKEIEPAVLAGLVWAFTPWRTITLVHAVRQPLIAPSGELLADRAIGDTFAHLSGRVRFSRKSTGRMDFHASWPAPVDDGPGTGIPSLPANQPPTPDLPAGAGATPTAGAKIQVPLVARGEQQPQPETLEVDVDHEFGDTKHKPVTYIAEATTRFAEYFRHTRTVVVSGFGPANAVTLAPQGISPRVTVRSTDGATSYPGSGASPAWSIDAKAGTIWFNSGAAQGVSLGQSVDVVYIPQPLSRFRLLEPEPLDIPASARPLAPDVALLTPAFGWTASADAQSVTSSRTTVLRVYLRRPWWTSGVGEKLGVVLPPAGLAADPTALPEALEPYVSLWGADPAYSSGPLPSYYLTPSAFRDRAGARDGLFLDELPHANGSPDLLVGVAAHDVFYDANQDLWYSDIRIDGGGSYMPFLRLALARFQPVAVDKVNANTGVIVDNVNLSRVVLADFAQLAPDRSATVVFQADQQAAVVNLFGPTYGATHLTGGPGLATITVQAHRADVRNDLGWANVGSPTQMTVAQSPSLGSYWTAQFKLPTPRSHRSYRLLVEQHDLFEYEAGSRATNPNQRHAVVGHPRLVHSDVIPL